MICKGNGSVLPLFRSSSFPDDAPGRDRGHRQRDQHAIAGERQAQKAPLHLVAADHLLGIEARQQVAGAAEISDRSGAIGRSLPELPFDAGMIGAEHGVAECRGSKKRKARDHHSARRIPCRGERDQRAERDRQVIGVALLEAERTGADIQHQLKEPRARQRRRRNDRDCQRRGQRGVRGGVCMRLAGGGVECHIRLPGRGSVVSRTPGAVEKAAITLGCFGRPTPRPDRATRGLTGRARPLYSAGFATSASGQPLGRCPKAPVAELVDALDSKSSSARSAGSIPARGTILPSALIRQRSLSSIKTGTSRIFGFAAVRPNLMVSGDFHGIFHGRSLGSWYRDFWVESNRCRSRTTPIFGT